jgi:hypothetical protein
MSSGGVVSDTTTPMVVLRELPARSVAVHVTTVVPRLNGVPLAGEQLDEAMPDASELLNVNVATAVGVFPLVGEMRRGLAWVKGARDTVGLVVSVLLMEKEQAAIFPAPSVTEHAMTVNPRGAVKGEDALQVGPVIPELSEATGALKMTDTVGTPVVGVTVEDAGHSSAGSASSTMLNGNEHDEVREALSVAVQPTVVVEPTV